MKIVFITILILNCTLSFTQDLILNEKFKSLILSTLIVEDSNPTQEVETNRVNSLFVGLLSNYPLNGNAVTGKDSVFQNIYENASSFYEDSPDSRRLCLRRAVSFASLSVMADYEKSATFLSYARVSLMGSVEEPVLDLLEEPYLGLLLLDLLLKVNEEDLQASDVLYLASYLEKNREAFNKSIYDKSMVLIKGLLVYLDEC